MKVVDKKLISKVALKSRKSERKRANVVFHKPSDKVQRMVAVLQPDTYAQPHKHENPDKVEMFIVLKGKLAVLEFDDNGEIGQKVILTEGSNVLAVEISPRKWHTIICLDPDSTVIEILEGPYDPITHKKFAPWAPKEGTKKAEGYLAELKRNIIQ